MFGINGEAGLQPELWGRGKRLASSHGKDRLETGRRKRCGSVPQQRSRRAKLSQDKRLGRVNGFRWPYRKGSLKMWSKANCFPLSHTWPRGTGFPALQASPDLQRCVWDQTPQIQPLWFLPLKLGAGFYFAKQERKWKLLFLCNLRGLAEFSCQTAQLCSGPCPKLYQPA